MNKKTAQPVPQGKYRPAIRHADVIYTSGMTPRKAGKLLFSGQIKAGEPIETYREAVRLACQNALIAAESCLQEGEEITAVLQLQVFLNAEEGYTAHAKMADYASEVLMEKLSAAGMGSRAAIGVASLPSNAPVEITLVAKVN